MNKYTCPKCGKDCINGQGLSSHIKIHNGKREQTCPKCGKVCTSGAGMAMHMTTHGKRKVRKAHKTEPEQSPGLATLTGPGMQINFSVEHLPEMLHTLAFSLSGGKKEER